MAKRNVKMVWVFLVAVSAGLSGCICQTGSLSTGSDALHAKCSYVDHSSSTWTESIYVKKGQSVKVSYELIIGKGVLSIGFTPANQTDPHYCYSAYDKDYKGNMDVQFPETGIYDFRIESKDFTGSYDISLRVVNHYFKR